MSNELPTIKIIVSVIMGHLIKHTQIYENIEIFFLEVRACHSPKIKQHNFQKKDNNKKD